MTYAFKIVSSRVGLLKLVANDLALVAILWENDDPKQVRLGSLVEDVEPPYSVSGGATARRVLRGRQENHLIFRSTSPERRFRRRSGPSCSTFRLDRHEPTARSPMQSASLAPSERSARQTERIRSPLWRHAIA